MRELVSVLERFEDVTGVKAVVWTQANDRSPIVPEYGEWHEPVPRVLDLDRKSVV